MQHVGMSTYHLGDDVRNKDDKKPSWWKLWLFLFLLSIDTACSVVLLGPFIWR